jgi:NADH:ubiquinone oxidoreductase subunit E
MVNKKTDGIDLVVAEYINNPFKHFLENTTENAKLLALIPFVRNIVEYTKEENDSELALITSMLHIMPNTNNITLSDVKKIIKNVLRKDITVPDERKNVADSFIETADSLVTINDSLNLENKIVLSIAIRLKTEKFLMSKIRDDKFITSITSNQTAKLIDKYIKDNPSDTENIDILKKVNLITPQNIHINSFMYEPIIDMSDIELKDLYRKVKDLRS